MPTLIAATASIPVMLLLELAGLLATVFMGALFSSAALWTNTYALNNLGLSFLAQIFTGLAMACLLNSVTKNSFNWFPTEERDMASALVYMSFLVGAAFSVALPLVKEFAF